MAFNLPDFDEMLKISDRVGYLTTSVSIRKMELDDLLAIITHTVTSDEKYWAKDAKGNPKQPAMNFIIATFHRRGFDDFSANRLSELRCNIAEMSGELGKLRMVFSVYRDMIDVWKADQYNKREAQY